MQLTYAWLGMGDNQVRCGDISILAAIALPAYQNYIAKSQLSEAFTLADGAKTTIATNRERNSCTSTESAANTLTGKYGTLVIDGTPDPKATDNKTGCTLTYTVKTDASDRISGKVLVLDVLQNGSVKKNSWGGDDELLPTAVK